MSGFTIPNTPDSSVVNQNQAEPDSLDFQILGKQVNGVVSGMAVTINGSGSTINVASGEVLINGAYYSYAGITNFPVTTFSSSSFFDLVVARFNGTTITPVVLTGNTGVNPRFPTVIHSTDVVLAAIWRTGSSLSSNEIVDKRVFVRSNSNRVGATATGGNHADTWVQPPTWSPNATLEGPLSVNINGTWYKMARYSANFTAGTISATTFSGNLSGTVNSYSTSVLENANTLVVRDGSGNIFAVNGNFTTVSGNLYGQVESTFIRNTGSSLLNSVQCGVLEPDRVEGINWIRTTSGGTKDSVDFGWTDDTNTGMFNDAQNIIKFSAGGVYSYRINSSGGANTSSLRYKTDIKDCSFDLSDLYNIRLVTYKPIVGPDYTAEIPTITGVIAEELDAIEGCKQFVLYDEQGRPDAVAYDRLAVAYIELLKDHESRLQALENVAN